MVFRYKYSVVNINEFKACAINIFSVVLGMEFLTCKKADLENLKINK